MYNAMYPSHMVVQFNPQIENRRFARGGGSDVIQLMNFDMPAARRRDLGFHHQHQHHLSASQSRLSMPPPPPSQLAFRPVLNTHVADYWNSRFSNGKQNTGRLRHGISAPCLTTAGGDESSDSGLSSRSPTPNRQNPVDQSSLEESSEESISGDFHKTNKRGHNLPNQAYQGVQNMVGSRGQANHHHQRRSCEQSNQLNSKRRYNTGRYTNQRGRRITNMMLHIASPFPQSYLSTPYGTAPDRFFSRSHLVQVKLTPNKLTSGSIWDQLSRSIWKKFMNNQQTEETFKKKMVLWKYLYVYIKTYYPKYGLYLVGSTMSGFGSNCSDVDMCLLVRHCEIDQRNEAVSYLGDILRLLQRCEFIEKPELIQAKVPILKFRDGTQGLEVDLNCNNSVGIRNTHLLHCYAQMDWRVRPLVLVVKLWANWHNINDAKNMTISSYSLALMVIHFLQFGVTPAVLPCLHALYRDKFMPNSDISSIDIHEELRPYFSENSQPLGELLVQFFQYYTDFDYMHFAISVRLANILPVEECRHIRTPKNDPHQWKYLCIEEPFDLTNTARSVYDPEVFERIRGIISRSAKCLSESHKLDSIFMFESAV